jgi:hypothetical protein
VAVEGLGDATDWQEAPACGGNFTTRCNRHLAEFASAQKDPSTHFADIRASYIVLRAYTVLLNDSISAAPAPLSRSRSGIIREHAERERYLWEAAPESREFYIEALLELRVEMGRILGEVSGDMESD